MNTTTNTTTNTTSLTSTNTSTLTASTASTSASTTGPGGGVVATRTRTIPAQRFGRQLHIETRKLLDTRGSLAVLAGIIATCLFALIWLLAHAEFSVTFHRYSTGVGNIVAFLIPIVTLLAMTSEWTQRTALSTFTLSPRRGRVITAKFVAALAVSAAVLVSVLLLAAGATALGGMIHGHASWSDIGFDVRSYFTVLVLETIMAAAFALLTSQTAVALVAYFIAPTVWASAAPTVLGTSARWLDIFETYNRLSSHAPFERLGQTVTSVAMWVIVPAVFGIRRSLRREVK